VVISLKTRTKTKNHYGPENYGNQKTMNELG